MEHYLIHQGIEVLAGRNDRLMIGYEKLHDAYRSGELRQANGGMPPAEFLRPENGFYYRFPFPEEWLTGLGAIPDWPEDRGVHIRIARGDYLKDLDLPALKDVNVVRSPTQPQVFQVVSVENPNNHFARVDMEIAFQKGAIESGKIVQHLVLRCAFSGTLITIDNLDAAEFIIEQIQEHYLQHARGHLETSFWNEIIISIIRGYSGLLDYPENL